MHAKTLVFSVAINGYHWKYKKNIDSHRAYAAKQGYRYVVVDRPVISLLDMECAWLKVALMIEALKAGYQWVLFVDADAEIRPEAPPIESLDEVGKCLYMARGYSQRINSGVLIAKQSEAACQFFRKVLENSDLPLSKADDVGWGENGHIIHFAKDNPSLKLISRRWNNNGDFFLKDHIRHYSAGPLREKYRTGLIDQFRFLLSHYSLAVLKRLIFQAELTPDNFRKRLALLIRKSVHRYSEFSVV